MATRTTRDLLKKQRLRTSFDWYVACLGVLVSCSDHICEAAWHCVQMQTCKKKKTVVVKYM